MDAQTREKMAKLLADLQERVLSGEVTQLTVNATADVMPYHDADGWVTNMVVGNSVKVTWHGV